MKKVLLVGLVSSVLVGGGCRIVGSSHHHHHHHGHAPAKPVITQTLAEFHRPESSAFSLDGRSLFISNCASGNYGKDEIFALKEGEGCISKLSVAEDGTLKVVKRDFVKGLNAPLGIEVLPKATTLFPKGTLFVSTGIYITCDEKDKYIPDPKRLGTGITILDPETGKILGRIDTTPGSVVTKAIGDMFPLPNGLTFDAAGNLYVADTGESCGVKNTVMPAKGSGGVLRVDHAAIDAVSQGKDTPGISFVPVALPNGVMYNPHTDAILIVTCSSEEGKEEDAVYSVPVAEFATTKKPKAIATGLGIMDGAAVTPAGSIIVSLIAGQSLVKVGSDGSKAPVVFDPDTKFMGPSDLKLRQLADGSSILILPEQDHTNPDLWKQRVRVISIPKGY